MSTQNQFAGGKSASPPPWTVWIPEEEYHADAGSGTVVSSGMLREFRLCPARYRDLVAGAASRGDCGAFRFGRAVHKLVLEGEAAFASAFRSGGPVNARTGRSFGAGTRAFAGWLRDAGLDGRNVLTGSEAGEARRLAAAVRAHGEAGRLLSRGWPERSARADLERVPCQIRLDWLAPDGTVADLKTADDLDRFEIDARRFGYLHQFAFYRDVARAAGAGDPRLAAVVVEKRPPFRVGVWHFPDGVLDPYAAQNRLALASLRLCREENRWPTGFETPRSFPPAGIPPLWLN